MSEPSRPYNVNGGLIGVLKPDVARDKLQVTDGAILVVYRGRFDTPESMYALSPDIVFSLAIDLFTVINRPDVAAIVRSMQQH